MLELKEVSTEYDKIPMLKKVSLNIKNEEIVCLLGANGAGKTTILKTILSLVKPTEGTTYFQGKRIDILRTHNIVKLGVSIIPEGRRIFPKMTNLENLRLGAYFEKDEKKIEKRLKKIYELFPIIKKRLKQTAGTLSGGEQAMLAIARGMMGHPKIMLLDEPSLGLAPKIVDEYFEIIKRINKEEKIAIFLVEQNPKEALSIASRGYILQKGKIIIGGLSDELLKSQIIRNAYLEA